MFKAYINLKGGIGNQLFQYAFGESIKKKWNCDVIYNLNWFDKPGSNTPRELALTKLANINSIKERKSKFESRLFQSKRFATVFNKFNFFHGIEIRVEQNLNFSEHYQEIPHKLPKKVIFNGYWQSFKYFSLIEADLRNQLLQYGKKCISSPLMQEITSSLQSTSIHIRRGDYIKNKAAKNYFETCSTNYYQNAIKKINKSKKDNVFFVFSDDIDWAKTNIKTHNKTIYVDSNYNLSDLDELFLMANCNNHIIANSSFSWWGAWIGGLDCGITIRPRKWLKSKNQPNTLCPKEWIEIDNH